MSGEEWPEFHSFLHLFLRFHKRRKGDRISGSLFTTRCVPLRRVRPFSLASFLSLCEPPAFRRRIEVKRVYKYKNRGHSCNRENVASEVYLACAASAPKANSSERFQWPTTWCTQYFRRTSCFWILFVTQLLILITRDEKFHFLTSHTRQIRKRRCRTIILSMYYFYSAKNKSNEYEKNYLYA